MLPNKLQHGDSTARLFDLWNQLIDYLREIRLVAGNGIRINRLPAGTTIESTATAAAGAVSVPDSWRCDIIPDDNGGASVTVILNRDSDNWKSVIFRGKTYSVDSETFTLSASDLTQTVSIYLVKTRYAPVRFLLAPSHNSAVGSFSAGCVRIATITKQDGNIRAYMDHDRMFEWTDGYQEAGKFTADLLFTGIIHSDDESGPEPIPFYDFTSTAEQKLLIHNNYALMVNDLYVIGTEPKDVDIGPTSDVLLSIRPQGHENDALQVFWTAGFGYGDTSKLANIHYELVFNERYPYHAHGGMIRIPVVYLTEVTRTNPFREIDHTRGAPNFPEIALNTFGRDADAALSSWVYIDRASQTVRLRIRYSMDGFDETYTTLNAPFSAFTGASGSELSICSYYNITSHTWSSVWFALDGTAITTEPTPEGGSDNKRHKFELAYISYNSADSCPYVIGQNCTRTVIFSSAYWRFQEFAGQIADLYQKYEALKQRVSALEQSN